MGTRNLTIVRLDGETRVAQYSQYDGYLTGQGSTVYDVLSYPGAVDQLRKAVRNASWITNEEFEEAEKSVGIDTSSIFVEWSKAKEFSARYPELSRDTGAGILQYIIDNPYGVKIENAESFESDPDCEYAYVVDLDRNVLEVYDRYDEHKIVEDPNKTIPDETGMKLFGVFPLDDLDDFKNLIQSEMKSFA